MVSPGYHYDKAPDQDHFLRREQTTNLFRQILSRPKRSWRFNQTPLFLEFLRGGFDLECTPWGSPTYNLFGWQRPCYLLSEGGYAKTFCELMESTDWDAYGRASGNPKCADCMVHCGYEPSAVEATFGTFTGLARTAWRTFFGLPPLARDDVPSERPLAPPVPAPHLLRPAAPRRELLQIGR